MNEYEWLSKLVSFDTTSKNSNLPLIEMLQEWFSKHRIETRLTRDPKESKANLFATLPGEQGGGLVLSGHTDVVPVDGQSWDTDPFQAVTIKDKIYGRGTCDMKGFLAVALSLIPEFHRLKLKKSVHFAFSYDEEIGCRGAPLIIADLQQAGIKPEACIVGEPSDMLPTVAHKGVHRLRCRVHGKAAHSALTPQGCNAIEHASSFIVYIRSLADKFRQEGPFDDHFDVPFTTLSTNMIHGGNAENTIPALCEFLFEFRHLPKMDPKGILEQFNAYLKQEREAKIEMDNMAKAPGFEASEEAPLTKLVRKLTGDHKIRKAAFTTEAGLFQRAHIPSIICGPGSLEQAHRANEYVSIEQLEKCKIFLRKAVEEFCTR